MDLVTNGVYVTNAYNNVQAKLDQLNAVDKQRQNISHTVEDEQTTTNGIF